MAIVLVSVSIILVVVLALSHHPRVQAMFSQHQPTLTTPGVLEPTDFECEPSGDAIPKLAERGEIRPSERPVGVGSNAAMATFFIERPRGQLADSSRGMPIALRSAV
ncbi:MAG TPA: hypothetical protein VEN29_16040 [Casimicrobiaceae bacterium]|nr:hypothetical protein [Casimicrobiaceae bacterium]